MWTGLIRVGMRVFTCESSSTTLRLLQRWWHTCVLQKKERRKRKINLFHLVNGLWTDDCLTFFLIFQSFWPKRNFRGRKNDFFLCDAEFQEETEIVIIQHSSSSRDLGRYRVRPFLMITATYATNLKNSSPRTIYYYCYVAEATD